MTAVSVNPVRTNDDGKRVVEAVILSDTIPSPLPTDGTNVTGLCENDVFAPFSVLYIVHAAKTKLFIADESGAFIAQ